MLPLPVNGASYSRGGGGPARHVPTLTADGGKPGKFKYVYREINGVQHAAGMQYVCFGCKTVGFLPFRNKLWPPRPKHDWEWNGNVEKPTLSPSIHHVGCWHGHLVNGTFKSC